MVYFCVFFSVPTSSIEFALYKLKSEFSAKKYSLNTGKENK
jgi:hypothetical protein